MTAVAVGGKKERKQTPGARTETEPSGPSSGASAGVPVFLRRSPDSSASSSDSFAPAPSAEGFGASPSPASAPALPTSVVVGGVNDPAEREAESVASAVLAGSSAPRPSASSAPDALRRSPEGGSSAPAPSGPAALPGHGPGTPMSPRTRGALEGSLGADLSGVRVHGDTAARSTAASLGARAFAVGSGIYLGPGASDEDLGLMAHETTHVLQGGSGVIRRAPAAGAPAAPPPPRPAPAPAPAPASAAPPAAAAPKAADKKKKKDDKGKTKKGGAGEEKAASAPEPAPAGGGGPSVEMRMPEPRLTLAADEKAAVAEVKDNAKQNAEAAADLPPADAEVADARGAVQEPEEQTAARAQEGVVADLSLRQPPSPEIEALCDRIYEAIRAKRPPDEDELVEAKPQEAADAAGSELSASVQGDAQRVEGSYGAIDAPPAGTPEKVAEGMEPPPPAPEVPVASAAAAAPDTVPPEQVSLDADVEASAAKAEEAGLTTPAALEVKQPGNPVVEQREAQGELQEVAKKGPEEALAEQRAALDRASGEMAGLQAAALARLAKSRDRTVTGTGGQKKEMVGSEEEMRAAAGKEARDIFALAQADVRTQLRGLPKKAMEKWEQGKKTLALEFDQALARVKEWIDKRHSGAGGAVLSVVDYVTGLPGWVVKEYDRAEKAFGDGVCDLIREISSDVNTVVFACEQIIDDARVEIKKVFDALPDSLDGWAAEQMAAMDEQLDGLASEARETRDNFNKELTTAAATAVQEARSKIHELRQAAGGLLGRIAGAIGRFLDDPVKFIIDGLLDLVGIEPSRFWSLISRIQSVAADIAADPLGFAGNLLAGIAQGFSQFFDRFGTHLTGGFFDWLTAGLAKAGITLPTDFSLKGILTFILQLMGITWDRIRRLLGKHLGDKNIALIEKAWEMVSMLIEKGPEGIFELVKEKLDPRQIIDQIIQAGVQFLVEGLVKAVSVRILGMLNPVGAIVQAIEAIYRVVSWIFENAARLFTLVEAVVNGMAQVVAGNVSGMAAAVEGALAGLIAPVIDFLADYMGLGGLPEKIKGVIEGMQAWVEGILDSVIGFLADKARGLLAAMGIGGKKEPPPGKESAPAGDDQVGEVVPFSAAGEDHKLWVDVEGRTATPMVASDKPRAVELRLQEWDARLHELSSKSPPAGGKSPQERAASLIASARRLNAETDRTAEQVVRDVNAAEAGGADAGAAVTAKENALKPVLEDLFVLFGDTVEHQDLKERFKTSLAQAAPDARADLEAGIDELVQEQEAKGKREDYADYAALLGAMRAKDGKNSGGVVLRRPLRPHDFGKWAEANIGIPAVQLAVDDLKSKKKPVPPKAESSAGEYLDSFKGTIHNSKGAFVESGPALTDTATNFALRSFAEDTMLREFIMRMTHGDDIHNLYAPKNLTALAPNGTGGYTFSYDTHGGAHFDVTLDGSKVLKQVKGTGLKRKAAAGVVGTGYRSTAPGQVANADLNAAHVIADDFLGSGYKSSLNLIATSAKFNQDDMSKVEDEIRRLIKLVKPDDFDLTVDVEWTVVNDPVIAAQIAAAMPSETAASIATKIAAFAAKVDPGFQRVQRITYTAELYKLTPGGRTAAHPPLIRFIGPDLYLGWPR
ncbi:MAG TPA: DUF4157 domain-containing protein [Longimicrobium sp.]|uniref:eCIS core domain-containing protein n=1 Tax=Longimicrobium sp. TaxID=2029185 RepID=UPI002ED9ED25